MSVSASVGGSVTGGARTDGRTVRCRLARATGAVSVAAAGRAPGRPSLATSGRCERAPPPAVTMAAGRSRRHRQPITARCESSGRSEPRRRPPPLPTRRVAGAARRAIQLIAIEYTGDFWLPTTERA